MSTRKPTPKSKSQEAKKPTAQATDKANKVAIFIAEYQKDGNATQAAIRAGSKRSYSFFTTA